MAPRVQLDTPDLLPVLHRMAGLLAGTDEEPRSKTVLLGIANGGIALAQRLAGEIRHHHGIEIPVGVVDASFHRDDLNRTPIPKEVTSTFLPEDIEDGDVLLVDDVLFTGRTVRAALEEIFHAGRPSRVRLAVLCDRGNRKLPIQPDFTGMVIETHPDERVRVEVSPQPGGFVRLMVFNTTQSAAG